MDYHILAINHLMAHDIRPSVQRVAIMQFLLEHKTHPTVADIYDALYKEMPMLSKTTIYNTLKLFTDQGAILSLNIDEKNVRYDADISEHAHFRCSECERLFDLPLPEIYLSMPAGFQVKERHLYYRGVCPECQQAEDKI